jgi:hypothetical protein
MNSAAFASISFGLLLLLLYGSLAFRPQPSIAALGRFPRTVWPGRLLTVMCLTWFAFNLWKVDLGGFNGLKQALYVAVPVSIYLVIVYIPDLLSVRGVCGLILLAAQPLLVATRWTGTPASMAVAVFTYILILKAMMLMVYPHLWIRSLRWWKDTPAMKLPALALGGAVGAVLILCGVLSL